MPLSIESSSIFTGLGLSIYGGYKYLATTHRTASEINEQKKAGLKLVAAGVAAIALGVGLIYSGTTTKVEATASSPPIDTLTDIEAFKSCPIDALKTLFNEIGRHSLVSKAFEVLEDNQGISCSNYLPWKEEFSGAIGRISHIKAADLKKPVMWGIDELRRPYIAFRYVCDQTREGAATLFQRFPPSIKYENLVAGGVYKPAGCNNLGPLNPVLTSEAEFLGNLTSFLKGEAVFYSDDEKPNTLTLTK